MYVSAAQGDISPHVKPCHNLTRYVFLHGDKRVVRSDRHLAEQVRRIESPQRRRAVSKIPEFDQLLDKARATAPARSLVSIDDVGIATAFLAHDAARLITGATLYVDGGYHIID